VREWFSWEDTKKIIKIRSLTPPIACESERGPALQGQEFKLNEVRVSILVKDKLYSACVRTIIPQTRQQDLSSCYDDSTAVRACEALALSFVNLTACNSFVDKALALRAIPERIYARKPCTSACKRLPARSSTIGKLFPAAAIASKSR